MKLDDIDRRLLIALQQDADRPIKEIAEAAGISTTPAWRRIRAMEAAGVIGGRVAIVDAAKAGLGVTVFVQIKTDRHDDDWMQGFARGARAMPEIVEIYRMAGDVDYLLKVVVPSIAAYDAFYKRLIKIAPLADVAAGFAMEQIKNSTALPVELAV
ncbi:MAG: Lrp/AsnC family transcriptional regulator [Pseudomonadota bacterium]